MRPTRLVVLLAVLVALAAVPCGAQETICDDGVDNDTNGLTDCDDPSCDGRSCDGIACETGDGCFNILPGFGICFPGTPDDAACDDGFTCTSEVCDAGDPAADADGCVITPDDAACDDGFTCTSEVCDPADPGADGNGCVITPDDAACDDGALCTADACDPTDPGADANGCVITPDDLLCDDGILCTTDTCDPADPVADGDGCVITPDDTACDDGITCTSDRCLPGFPGADPDGCIFPIDDTLCDDAIFCNGVEVCEPTDPGADPDGCLPGSNPCPDPGAGCDEPGQTCFEVACRDGADNDGDTFTDCDDSDCPPATPEVCDDGVDNDCNGLADCADPACLVDNDNDTYPPFPCGGDCDDSNPDVNPGEVENCLTPDDDDCDGLVNCTDPDCSEIDEDGDGQAPLPCGEDCDDNDPNNWWRNIETCTDGGDNNCDGLADCADPTCDGRACDDGYACTIADACGAGTCEGLPIDGFCDDGVACTNDRCLPGFPGGDQDGCFIAPDDASCEDGLFCNGEETCDPADPAGDGIGCVNGPEPCAPPLVCNEDTDSCEQLPCVEDAFEPDDTCLEARLVAVLPAAQSEDHTLCREPDDRDRIRFDVRTGVQYSFHTTGETDTRGILTTLDCAEELAVSNDCSMTDRNFCISWIATYTGQATLTVEQGGPPPAPAGAALQSSRNEYTLWYQEAGTVCVPDGYEPEDSACATATIITPSEAGSSQAHTVCPPGDPDRFRFLGQVGETYTFTGSGQADSRAEIRPDDCGTVLATADSCQGGNGFCLSFTPAFTSFYTVNVYGQTPQTTGEYTFTYRKGAGSECSPDLREPDDLCSQATFLDIGPGEQALTGSVCPSGDVDTFRFAAQAGTIYSFETLGTTNVRGMIQTEDCGTILADADRCGPDAMNFCLDWRAPQSGDYTLTVRGADGGVTGDYVLRYRESDCPPDAWEPDDRCDQATLIGVDPVLKRQGHTICPGEELDFFEFEAQEGVTYSFRTEGLTDTAGAVLAANCRKFFLKNQDCGVQDPDFCLTWTAPETGTYKLAVTGDQYGGPYDLVYQQVSDPGTGCTEDGAEPDDACARATHIFPDVQEQTLARSVCPTDDRDHFIFQAEEGRTYRFWSSGQTDTLGNVRDNQCAKILGNDDCNLPEDMNFCLTWTAPADGTYLVRVRGFSRKQTVGPYLFHYLVLP